MEQRTDVAPGTRGARTRTTRGELLLGLMGLPVDPARADAPDPRPALAAPGPAVRL